MCAGLSSFSFQESSLTKIGFGEVKVGILFSIHLY